MHSRSLLLSTLSLLPLAVVSLPAASFQHDHEARQAAPNSGDVIIQMFEWNWDAVAKECTAFIGPAGYKYVQVSPAQEHITGDQWWTSYQAVSYQIQSKRGSRDQFQNMVSTCKSAGVSVLSDVLVNHMAGIDSGTGVAGSSFSHYNYPGVYSDSNGDFHHCGTPGDDIADWNNGTEVQTCELSNLADLNTESSSVQSKISGHLKDLLSLGVSGFRIDAAKHVPASELSKIVSSSGRPEFVTQEVVYGSGNVQPTDYTGIGSVTEFQFRDAVYNAFTAQPGFSLSTLSSVGSGSYLPSANANVFIATHDSERGGTGPSLRFDSPSNEYTNAHVFMLAHPYGHPTVLSSYEFNGNNDMGAPNGGAGTCDGAGGSGGYVCQHRWTAIAGMVGFRKSAGTEGVSGWTSPQSDQIAFGRGANAFVAINNADSDWSNASFQTSGMADGSYCDVISGCATKVTVSNGAFTATVPKRGALAIHVGAKA